MRSADHDLGLRRRSHNILDVMWGGCELGTTAAGPDVPLVASLHGKLTRHEERRLTIGAI